MKNNRSRLTLWVVLSSVWLMVLVAVAPAVAIDPMQARMLMMPASAASAQIRTADFKDPDAIDNSIDPAMYIIGGGDQFFISVIQIPSLSYTPTVNDNGDVFIGDLGVIKLGPVSLMRARELITDFFKTRLKKEYDIYVSLKSVKTATVSVTGAIDNPGTYQLRGTLRILDALKSAQNGNLPALHRLNYREVRCSRGDSVWYCDLFQYLYKGDRTQNPYVYPGDNIIARRATQGVVLCGAVLQPIDSLVPIRSGETLGELLSLFTLLNSADSNAVIIAHANVVGGNAIITGSLTALNNEVLHDQDVITIAARADYEHNTYVGITGEVKRPGNFPMIKGHTAVPEALGWAGGFTEDADQNAAFIFRGGKRGLANIGKADNKPMATSVRPEISSAIANMSMANDMTIIPYAANKSMVLEPGDVIVIPRKDAFVYISGNVRRPGAYAFKAGQDYSDYIDQAGGYTDKADRGNVFAVMRWRDISQAKDPRDLAAGNILVVPDAVENKQLTTIVIPIIGLAVSIIQVIITTYVVFR